METSSSARLKRTLNLPMVTAYGVGTIIGGGFYALTGKVAETTGMLTPWALLVASLIALCSAFSFAELAARFPVSAGEARYVEAAFGKRWLSAVIGWMVIATGVVSAATLADAFGRFATHFADVPNWIVVLLMVMSLGAVAAWGIQEAAWVVLAIAVVEIGGLMLVLLLAGHHLTSIPQRWGELVPGASWQQWSAILLGAYLSFYSFIGFEDMVNVAEEVREPERNLPIAILCSVLLTTLLYVLVSLVVVLSTPPQQLGEAASPLSVVLRDSPFAGDAVALVGMLAGLNGALVQIVMATRVTYGLARRNLAPVAFGTVHHRTQTPLLATVAATSLVLALALWLPLTTLAQVTSTILLLVYAAVNMALWRIKRRDPTPPEAGPCYPLWLPILGTLSCTFFVGFQLYLRWYLTE